MFILDFLSLLILHALGPSLVCTDIFPITNNTRELKGKVDLKKKIIRKSRRYFVSF